MLTETLERILAWLQAHDQPAAASLQPGLSQAEIEAKVKELPFRLPQEVYELYQWRNGDPAGHELFPYHVFLPLEEAVHRLGSRHQLPEPWDPKWFPIFDFDESYYVVICDETDTEASPTFLIDEIPEFCVEYATLTHMIRTVAECYEAGAYYLNDQGVLDIDYEKIEPIRQRYVSDGDSDGLEAS